MKQPSDFRRKLRLLFWESTIACNLSCAHCRRVENDDTVGSDMTTAQAMDLIDQLARVGQSQDFMPILVFSGGEPLCRSDIFELIKGAAARKLICALATNGTLIDEAIARKIKEAGTDRVSISLDGATSEIHNMLRKLEGSFNAAVNGTRCLQACGVPFQMNMTVTRHNAHQLDEMFILAEELGAVAVHLFMLVPVGCGEAFAADEMLSADEYEQILERIAKKEHTGCLEVKVTCGPHYERVVREQNPGQKRMSKGCLAGSGVIFVGHRGDVFPCGYLPINCGHILQTPLGEIWAGSAHLARMCDANRLKGKCGICGYKTVCGGCRARAFAATGDYMESEPMCVYRPPRKGTDD